jgi:hypothetical protein
MSMIPHEPWAVRSLTDTTPPEPEPGRGDPGDCTGFRVEALDGTIGKVDRITRETGRGYVVVDTGPWIFGKKVMVPETAIDGIDWAREVVHVERPRAQVENAPEFDEAMEHDETYREHLRSYYSGKARSGADPM